MPKFTVLTLFPDMITQGTSHSVIGRAARDGIIEIEAVNIRDFTENKHRQADDYPYGGGCGMVMKAPPIYRAYLKVTEKPSFSCLLPRVLFFSPRGRRFDQKMAKELSQERDIILICGHYEGVDERVIELINPECVSMGDYVLSGGEIPALAVIDAVARLIPGVLGNEDSGVDESFSSGLLEYPQYTRPAEYEGLRVPEVLLSGDHGKISKWRDEKSLEITIKNRPDLAQDELIFVSPNLAMKDKAVAFRQEFIDENSRMNGSAYFLKCEDYESWLDYLGLVEKGEVEGRLRSTVYFAVGRESGEIIGIADIRHKLVDSHDHLPSYVNGHLGGSIRPSCRGRGYAKQLLRLSLEECAKYGNRRILVSCDKDNPASEHIIKQCGGVFDNEITEQNGNIIHRFWFDYAQ